MIDPTIFVVPTQPPNGIVRAAAIQAADVAHDLMYQPMIDWAIARAKAKCEPRHDPEA